MPFQPRLERGRALHFCACRLPADIVPFPFNKGAIVKIVCSTNMPFAREAFGTLGETVVLPEREIRPEHVRNADILAVRSTTKVNQALLDGSKIRFAGTATIGYDHFDVPYLESRGIKWCTAPGCNANSVAEYIISALLRLGHRHSISWQGKTFGVIGVGNVGSRVAKKAAALGMRVLLNDPPRQKAAAPEDKGGFTGLDDLLAESDVVTLHVPLTARGEDKTLHMADSKFFGKARRGIVFINSARGPVTDNAALLQAISRGIVAHSVLDTWDPEPAFPEDLLDHADIGTPHIAGHSFEGKVGGTVIVYREACRFLGIEPSWTPDNMMPPAAVPLLELDAAGKTNQEVLFEAVSRIYDIEDDDRMLRAGASGNPAERAAHFDRLRRNYRERREFMNTKIALKSGSPALRMALESLGFDILFRRQCD